MPGRSRPAGTTPVAKATARARDTPRSTARTAIRTTTTEGCLVSRLQVCASALDLIGETPILHLRSFDRPRNASIFAKLEFLNPGGSVKDRAALGMIQEAEKRGLLRPGSTIVEPTAGNTGIGLALVGTLRGYKVVLVVPEKYSREKKQIMTALGASLVSTPTADG